MSIQDPWVTVKNLRELLQDPKLRDDDEIGTKTVGETGNMPIVRDHQMIGWIELNPGGSGDDKFFPSYIEWRNDEDSAK